jgi:hypothetical protein
MVNRVNNIIVTSNLICVKNTDIYGQWCSPLPLSPLSLSLSLWVVPLGLIFICCRFIGELHKQISKLSICKNKKKLTTFWYITAFVK